MSEPWRITDNMTRVLAGANMAEDRDHNDRPRNDNTRPALEDPSSTMRRRPSSSTISTRTDMARATTTMGMVTTKAMEDSTTTEATEEEALQVRTTSRTTTTLGQTDPGEVGDPCKEGDP